MNLSNFFIIAVVILAGSSLMFGILYITDPAGLRKEPTKVTAAKNEAPQSKKISVGLLLSWIFGK